jgi:hypothetical protein
MLPGTQARSCHASTPHECVQQLLQCELATGLLLVQAVRTCGEQLPMLREVQHKQEPLQEGGKRGTARV